jgi:hypothetical protein
VSSPKFSVGDLLNFKKGATQMKKFSTILVAALITATFCISSVMSAATGDEKCLEKKPKKTPKWITMEPKMTKETIYFTGVSGKFATDQDGRDDAIDNSIKNVSKYLGTFFNGKYQTIVTQYGLSSQVADPTKASRGFEEKLTQAMVGRAKAEEWYYEKWMNKKTKEVYWKVYVKTGVDRASLEKSYQDSMTLSADDMKKQMDAANEEKAKAQFGNAMKAFEDAAKAGFPSPSESK